MASTSSAISHRALARLFGELTLGAAPDAGWILNRSDAGLLGSLDRLSAAEASVVHQNGSSVAAHVDHLRYDGAALRGPRERGPGGPRVRTPRLLLDPLEGSDLRELHAHWTSPGVRRYLWDGKVVSEDQVRESIERSRKLFDREGAGLWAVRERGDTRLVGCAGFWYFHEPPELELVYSLSEPYWGKGLGRECAAALIDHAFDALGRTALQSSADAPNEASLRLLRALGMQPAGTRPGEFGVIEVFRVTREQWRERA